jgi:hypothetical protein
MAADNTNLTPIAFSGTNSMSTPKALNSTAIFDSDAVSFSADATDCYLQVKVDNQGTPGSGDVVDVYLRASLDGGTTYDTDEHMRWVMRLDTYATNTPGEDPATLTRAISVRGIPGGKFSFRAAQGGTRTINVSAQFNEHTVT